MAATSQLHVNIDSADNVFIATNLNVYSTPAAESCHDVSSESQYIKACRCGCETDNAQPEGRQCRWTQTGRSFVRPGKNVIICENYNEINLLCNTHSLKCLKDHNYELDKIPPANNVFGCFARLDYRGNDYYSNAITACKLTTHKEIMSQLLREVLTFIDDEPDLSQLREAVKNAFGVGMKLLGIDLSSLVFIFQHSTEIAAKRLLTAYETDDATDQYFIRVKKMLHNFLPSWVKEEDCKWTIMRCEAASDRRKDCSLDRLINLQCSDTQDVSGTLENKHFGQIRDHVDQHMDHLFAFVSRQIAVQESTKQITQQILQALLGKQSTTENPSASVQTDSPHAAQEEHPSPAPCVPQAAHTSAVDSPSNIQQKPSVEWKSSADKLSPVSYRATEHTETTDKLSPVSYRATEHTETAEEDVKALLRENPSVHSKRSIDHDNKQESVHLSRRNAVAAPAFIEQVHPLSCPTSNKKGQHSSAQDISGIDLDIKGKHSSDITHEAEVSTYTGIQHPRQPHYELSGKNEKTIAQGKSAECDSEDAEGSPYILGTSSTTIPSQATEGDSSAKEPSETKKSQESKIVQAEQLINWVNVKSKASQSKDPEIQRLMEQVEHSLQDEQKPSPRARALDTVIVLDTSDSVAKDHLDELKAAVHTFIDGIEENVELMNLEENLAVVQIGDRAWVRQHLTNDYNRVRDAVDCMTPDSVMMRTGGRTPLFQAMLVCLGAIEGRAGGVVNVAGCHRVRPRLIFFTDGRPTDEVTETGPDTQSNLNEVKFALVQLVSEFSAKKHKTTPSPIFWVPIGNNADMPFLDSLAALSLGKMVIPNKVGELCRYYKIQETIGCVYKMVRKHKDVYETQPQILSIVNALAGNLQEEEKKHIVEEVCKKQKDPENQSEDAADFDNVYEDKENVETGTLPTLGTRVVRGQDWKWGNQDTEGPGTVIQHRKKQDGWLHVMWDNGSHNAYRYGDGECYDVEITDRHPRVLHTQLIDIGVQVERGEDWKSGQEDGRGKGVVIRKRKDGKVKVRWDNGFIGKYRFGSGGKMELKVILAEPPSAEGQPVTVGQPSQEELLGAVGGYDPAEGATRMIWKWLDHRSGKWRMYDEDTQDKLLAAYNQRKEGTCVLNRDGKSRRLLFKKNEEKTVDEGGGTIQVLAQVVTQDEYLSLLLEERNSTE